MTTSLPAAAKAFCQLLQTNTREPFNAALWTRFGPTKTKSWNFFRVQIHGRWHAQPPPFVLVKCGLALINWHYYISLPHLSLWPLYSPMPFHAPSHAFLSLPELWLLLMKGVSTPTCQHHTHVCSKNCERIKSSSEPAKLFRCKWWLC